MKATENTTYTLELNKEEYLLLQNILGDMTADFLIDIGQEDYLEMVRQMFKSMHSVFD